LFPETRFQKQAEIDYENDSTRTIALSRVSRRLAETGFISMLIRVAHPHPT
jgi:hypothetical protein